MKKWISLILTLTVLMGCFAGCAAQNQNDVPETGSGFDSSVALGDTLPELTLTTTEGQSVTVSEILKEKKLVVLNFWFVNCSWCLKEFPVMEVAYQRYREDVEILAVNPVDSQQDIKSFAGEKGYSFPMAPCSRELTLAFGVRGYPTSVFIDREGTVCLIHTGAITDVTVFDAVFEALTAGDYQSRTYASVEEFLN